MNKEQRKIIKAIKRLNSKKVDVIIKKRVLDYSVKISKDTTFTYKGKENKTALKMEFDVNHNTKYDFVKKQILDNLKIELPEPKKFLFF